ncbi:MAG: response regulator [candidate division Zixibacteria bacterium]|nr:response regulator [candidate division Zixibacteria bacterium]
MSDKKKILIVDDEPDVVEWLTVFFEENGYQTIGAYDGKEGFEKAQEQKPDLISLDISMEGESGVKMYKRLLESDDLKDIPVILVTGATPQLQNFFERLKDLKSPEGFFEKPVDKDELLKKVQELIP